MNLLLAWLRRNTISIKSSWKENLTTEILIFCVVKIWLFKHVPCPQNFPMTLSLSLSLLSTHCEWLKHDKNEKVTLQCRRILESYMPCCSWGSCSSNVPLIFSIYIFAEIYASAQPSHSQVGFINYDCFHFGARGYSFSLY